MTVGRILTTCVSRKKIVSYQGRQVSTGIFKKPIEGVLKLKTLNLEGDEQADLTVHGGPDKALYTYASEHYPWWRTQMPDVEFTYGKFGENLTTGGLLEDQIFIGDEFRVGSAVVRVSQPRLPCYKLGIRFDRVDIIKRFMRSALSGIYFAVVEEGEVKVGDEITYLRGDKHKILLADVAKIFSGQHEPDAPYLERDFLDRALDSQLAEQMKMFIRAQLNYGP